MPRRNWIACALIALLVACRPAPPAPTTQDADPALWVLQDDDTTIYLFGTVHVLKPGLSWFDEAVRDAFDASDSLVVETVLPDAATMQALVAELGMDPALPPLRERLPPPLAAKLAEALTAAGLSPDALDHAEPWLVATTLSAVEVERLGYARTDGAEATLERAAATAGKPITGLETTREQLRYFDTLSPEAQTALLAATLDEAGSGGAMFERIVAAWSAGDSAELGRLINGDIAASPELARALIADRNARWASWIAARMDRPGTVFVAVGAGHLAGDASVQAMLARKGLKVRRIDY
jgi:uncharacterized protein